MIPAFGRQAHLLVQPLTFWAMSVAARIVADADMATLITGVDMAPQMHIPK